MKIVSGEKMGEIDKQTMELYGIPGLVLMENAGLQVVSLVCKLRPRRDEGKIVVFCGRGNNGGDGFVISRHLQRRGYCVETWALGPLSSYKGDAYVNYDIFLKGGGHVFQAAENDPGRIAEDLQEADLIIDALLGTGIRNPVREPFAEVIRAINKSRAEVVSVDIPSGISAGTGEVLGESVRADYTVTFALPKRGLLLFPGAEYAGRVLVADIGIPQALTTSAEIRENLVTGEDVKFRLPLRVTNSHKGTYGWAFILSGSAGMTGAAALAGEAALRGGAGLVYVGTAAELRAVLEAKLQEVIVMGFPGDGKGNLAPSGADEILDFAGKCRVLAFGPGLDPGPGTLALLKDLLNKITLPMVVDAGGLGALALDPGVFTQKKAPLIVTPHPGEMARLTGAEVSGIQGKRWKIAAEKAQEWDSIVVLKGAHTVTALPDGEVFINPTGNPVLSTAGSGDILTGIVAALVAQGLSPQWGAVLGAYLHGLAGDLLAERDGERGHKAGDLLSFIPLALNRTAALPLPEPGSLYPVRDYQL